MDSRNNEHTYNFILFVHTRIVNFKILSHTSRSDERKNSIGMM